MVWNKINKLESKNKWIKIWKLMTVVIEILIFLINKKIKLQFSFIFKNN